MQRSEAVSHGRSDFTVGLDRVAADARYLKKNSVQVAATDYAALGASPPASGAIRIDAASFGNVVVSVFNGATAVGAVLATPGGAFQIYGRGGQVLDLGANNVPVKWRVEADAAGTSRLSSQSAVAQIQGGITNGLAIRNSANTRDNFLVADSGSLTTFSDGTRQAVIVLAGLSGEAPAGGYFKSGAGASGLQAGDAAGNLAIISYYNQTTRLSAAEVATTAAGFGTLALMKSGGPVVIGATSAHTTAQHQGDSTTQGWLFPRMTTAQKTAIGSPATGLVVFDTTLAKLCVYTGAVWETITSV